jgi:Sec-independent protein translocase protein TatA
MPFFIRRYQKGVKHSGTKDIMTSDDEIPISTFVGIAESTGVGKYILGQRGKGIRGFKKITDCIIDATDGGATRTFAAEGKSEVISIRKNEDLSTISDKNLKDLLCTMGNSPLEAEQVGQYQGDLSLIVKELESRGMLVDGEGKAADTLVAGAGFSPMLAFGAGSVIGLALGVLGTMSFYKKKMESLDVKLAEMEASIREAETTINKQEKRMDKQDKKAEQDKKNAEQTATATSAAANLDLNFLSSFNRKNGRYYD